MEAPGCVSGLFLQASHGVSPGLLGLEGDPVNCTSSLEAQHEGEVGRS